MKKLTEKGNIDALTAFVMGIGTIAVILAIVLYVLTELSGQMETDAGAATVASNATDSIIDKLGDAPTWIGLLIVVTFAVAVMSYFYMRR